MKPFRPTALALAAWACVALPAAAQSNAEILKELQDLKAKVADLEAKLKAAESKSPQWGMTPEQVRELNRVTVKAEALEDSRDDAGLKQLKFSGYADPSYIYNRNQNRAGFQFLNNVADDGYNYDNSYFGGVALDFQKETDSGTLWRLTLVPNRGTDSVIGNGGLVHEATVSVPLTDLQTRFMAGHIPDWQGYEYLQPTLNKLITHNLLFDFTLPTAYTGAGLDITRGKWWVRAALAQVNATKNPAGETAPAFVYRVDYSRGEFQGFGFAGVHGNAANYTENVLDPVTGEVIAQPNSRVDTFEFDAYFIRGDWTAQGQVSWGRQKKASITPAADGTLRDAEWWGLSGLLAYKFTPRFEGIVRADYIRNDKNGGGLLGYTYADDRNGIGPDATLGCDPTDPANSDPGCNRGANRYALSLGLSYLYDLNTTFKAEYRLDRADLPVFVYVNDGSYRKTNHLFGASVVVAW